jgi:hypothetical protein
MEEEDGRGVRAARLGEVDAEPAGVDEAVLDSLAR